MSETPKRRRAKIRAADEAVPEPVAEATAEEAPASAEHGDASEATADGPDAARADGSARPVVTLKQWFEGAPLPRDLALVFGLILPAMLVAANLWRVHAFTIDDSFISYRYARNFARGLGLVYNAGERIEGYTNFLFTVILAGGIKVGLDPEALAKGIGAASALGSLGLTYAISGRISPYRTLPCTATWLLASTIVFTGWSVFGLETGFFVCLILAGTYLFLRETGSYGHDGTDESDRPIFPWRGLVFTPHRCQPEDRGAEADRPVGPAPRVTFPWSGLVFALAGLTRPEAPMFIGVLMLFLGRRFLGRQNVLRGALFVVPVAAHLLFRHAYYGAWVPNTLGAKTGNIEGQIQGGVAYVQNYVAHAGPVLYLALLGVGIGLARKRRDVLALAAIGLCVLLYVIVVGGDWMKFFRFMAPFEPFCFILVDLGVRRAVDRRDTATNLALAFFAALMISYRGGNLREAQNDFIQKEKRFWDMATGGTARWLLLNEPGEMALGDIGYVGWATDYPILDLLGLVDPVIAKLPGGYTQKLGSGFVERFFQKKSKYFLLISSSPDCQHPSVAGSRVMWGDPRFLQQYKLGGKVPLDDGFAWCIYQRK